MFLVDAKNRAGRVTVWEGGLFQHTVRAGDAVSLNLAAELKKVHGMAAYMAVESGQPVTPVLCLAGAHEAAFGKLQMVQGVWVVPVSKLVSWLNERPPVLDRETVQRVVTRAMTDFPSTTTDPQLLAAIGHATARSKRARKPMRRQRDTPVARRPRKRSSATRLVGFVGQLALLAVGLWFFINVVPALITSTFSSLGDGSELPERGTPASTASADRSGSKTTATPRPSTKPTSTSKPASAPKPVVPAFAPTDCASATAAEVTRVLGRAVHPIAVASGCAWGTRLDDETTTLLRIRLSLRGSVYDSKFETSVAQRRVVYGTAYGPRYRPATALWVATGQPISTSKGRVKALADTHVVISTTELGLTDDQARRKALAIAAALTN
jgi:hypothetical protein